MKRFLAVLLVCSLPVSSFASTFKILGVRPMGMGGAHVAVAQGAIAQYWNPGALAMTKGWGVQVPVGVQFEATGDLLQKADNITNVANNISAIQTVQKNGTGLTLQQVKDFNDAVVKLNDLNNGGTGVLAGVDGGVNLRVQRIAVSVNNFTEVGATPFVDTKFDLGAIPGTGGGVTLSGSSTLNDSSNTTARNNLATVITNMQSNFSVNLNGATPTQIANKLINDGSTAGLSNSQITDIVNGAQAANNQLTTLGISSGGSGTPLANNQTSVTVRGAATTEAAFGYGTELPFPEPLGRLGLGGNVKIIRGDVGYAKANVVSGDGSKISNLATDFNNSTKSSYKPAVDIGLLWRAPFKRTLQLGLLERNINSPQFDQPAVGTTNGETSFTDWAQTRAGVAWWPFSHLLLASDLDLSKNSTAIPGFHSQLWGGGAELDLWILSLRAGLLKNIAENSKLSYTAGVGINLLALKIDLGAVLSSETVNVDSAGTSVPQSFQAGATVSFFFGSGNKPTAKKPKTAPLVPAGPGAPEPTAPPVQPI